MLLERSAIFFVILLMLSQSLTLFGQSADRSDWSLVKGLSSGTLISVETKDRKRLDGRLESVSDTALSFNRNNATVNVERTEIKNIDSVVSGSRAKSTAIGGAVGAGVGLGTAGILLASTGGSDAGEAILTIGALIGAGVGATLGAAFGRGKKRTLIYEAR